MRLLTTRSMFPSANLLRNDLEAALNRTIYITTRPARNIVLRWGCSADVGYPVDINTPGIINLASNKLAWSRRLSENGIFTPLYSTEEPSATDYPIIVRTTLSGFGGAGIHVCENAEQWRHFAEHYWTRFIKISSEFRVHVLGGTIVRLFRKVRETGEPEEQFPIRNLQRGYSFKLSSLDTKQKLVSLVGTLLTVIGATEKTMLALDVGWTDRGWLFLEGNSAPAMANENTRKLYVEHILKFLG